MRRLSKRQIKLLAVFIILIMVAVYFFSVGMQFVANLCAEEIRAEITDIINYSNDVLQSFKIYYEDYFTIHYNEGKVELITANTALINQVNMIIQTEIQNRLNELRSVQFNLPIGVFTGSALLAKFGFKVPITARIIANCYTKLTSEFTSIGINQTIHRLQINCYAEVKVLIPSKSVVSDIENEILMAETVIIGEVPSTYLGPNANTDYLDLLPD